MLSTLNYSEMTQAFMSFVSSKPKWYFDFGNRYYSFDTVGDLLLHNSNNMHNKMAKTTYPDRSFIRILVNDTYAVTKVFDNVAFTGDNISLMVNSHKFYTTSQESSIIDSLLIDKREDTYKFAIPRNIRSGTFIGSKENEIPAGRFADRMRGKYLVADYSFQNNGGKMFTLPFIETTYRYSMI